MTATPQIRNPVLILILSLVVSLVAGCQVTPLKQVVTAREVYTTALNEAVALRQAGKISDTTYNIIEPLRATAAAALDDAETASRAGVPATYDAAISKALSAAQDFAAAVSKAKASK